jgi:O-antigen ligase
VLAGFLASCAVLLAASYAMAIWPKLFAGNGFGVPVKSYIQQSVEFTVCAFALIYLAGECWTRRDIRRGIALAVLALAFLTDIFFVATSRTTLVVLPIILVVWAARQFGVKGLAAAVICGAVAAAIVWTASPYLRSRVTDAIVEVQRYETHNAPTSAGERLEFWKKSLGFVAEAPVIGHGTGSIRGLFEGAASGCGVSAQVSTNPHNLTLSVAVQLGALGVALLWVMWLAHLALFRHSGVLGWFGLLVVLQHIVGSAFNTYLFDFTEGWLYVFGVGVLGGAVRRGLPATDR